MSKNEAEKMIEEIDEIKAKKPQWLIRCNKLRSILENLTEEQKKDGELQRIIALSEPLLDVLVPQDLEGSVAKDR